MPNIQFNAKNDIWIARQKLSPEQVTELNKLLNKTTGRYLRKKNKIK
jgi:hypothetical protein